MQLHYPLNPTTGVEDPTQLPWTNGVPQTGQNGSFPPFAAVVDPMIELVNLIALAGLTPSDGDMDQVTRAVRGGQLDFDATDTGTADAVLCQVGLAHTAIEAGLPFTFVKGPTANTGNAVPTLTITDLTGNNGLTGTIVKAGGGAILKGDLPANALITVRARAPGVFAVVSLLTISDVLAIISSNGAIHYGVDNSTSPGSITVPSLNPPIQAVTDGMVFVIDVAASNPSNTLTVALPVATTQLTATAVRPGANVPVRPGDVVAGGQAVFVVLGGKLQLVNGQAVQSFFSKIVSSTAATYAVQPSDANTLFYVYNPNSVATSTTYTLPNADTMSGAIVSFFNNSANGITSTINTTPAGSYNYILLTGQSVSSVVLSNNSSLIQLRSDGTNWVCLGSSVDVGFLLGGGPRAPYRKTADGTIINRGIATVGPNSSATITLGAALSTAITKMLASPNDNSTSTTYPVSIYQNGGSLTQVQVVNKGAATITISYEVEGY